MKGILILFIDPADGGADYARDSEKFYNPKIKKASVTLDGNPNQLYASGMLSHNHFEEIQNHFADGKPQTTPHVIKEAESRTSGCNLTRLSHYKIRTLVGYENHG